MMYVSANEKAVSLNLHHYTTDDSHGWGVVVGRGASRTSVGRCTLN